MKSKPMLSIIIPLYNKEKYIIRCLNSIIEACDNYIEIIVVNDGSTDQSMTILSNYHHKDKITVINKENGGGFCQYGSNSSPFDTHFRQTELSEN